MPADVLQQYHPRQGGKRIVLDPGWDGRLKAIQSEAQAAVDLAGGRHEGSDRGETGSDEEWLPAAQAAERADRAGCPIDLPWLSRSAEKHGVKTRSHVLRGRHRREVEWNSLAGYLLRRRAAETNSDDPPNDETKEIEERKQKAGEQKRLGRSSD